ncbi:MAG: LysR family transcriptional regulator [Deltaproteobacteria bacterium]|nr:LysR family transcriptional regulator [Deltaproteobacteria bacterium]
MILDNLNLNHLRMFECVFRTKNMTKAAEELHLTQSGVSQHMKALEDSLGLKLFDRVRQRLVPTRHAEHLYFQCRKGLFGIEEALEEIIEVKKEISGLVCIGVPVEFGNNCILPYLSDLCKKYPKLRLNIKYGYAYEMNDLILNGALDFAFVDAFGFDRRIHAQAVYGEQHILCASQDYLKTKDKLQESKKFFESLEYIAYLKSEPVLRMWFKHHFKHSHIHLNVRATVVDVQGVAQLILSGIGVGILPRHHIQKLGSDKHKLYFFTGCGTPLRNEISVAYLRERSFSKATLLVRNELIKSFNRVEHFL